MIDLIKKLVDFILHIDRHLAEIIASYGLWTYAVLFLIIFAETGLVVTPFLPGDSLLFAAGAFCTERIAFDNLARASTARRREELRTLSVTAQSYFLNDRLITTVGLRRDRRRERNTLQAAVNP
ncbi:MAG: hypothetical protein RLZZ221_2220, partial [Verrucomicrobiota bacterium]